ncbi:MAG: YIP1 family protein [Proteobacteria bacterium]|nr:YIP1 family protein [Pseudomonadota bacterium]
MNSPSITPSHSDSGTSALIGRVKNMVLTPKTEWPIVEREPTSIGQLYFSYVVPLALLAAVLAFIHVTLIGVHVPFGGTIRQPVITGLMSLVMTLVGAFIGLLIVGLVINVLAPTFGAVRDLRQAVKTAAYAATPAWVGSLFGLLPAFSTLLQLAADCYAVYVLYLGLPIMMHGKQEKAAGYTATVVICTIVLGFVLGAVIGGVGIATGGALAHLMPTSEATKAAEREQAAATVGNVLGNMLGTDDKGKQDLGNALSKVAAAGDAMEKSTHAEAGTGKPATNDAAAPQDAGQAVGGLVAALGGALGGSHRVAPVDFQTLKGMLPASLAGMDRTHAAGEAKQGLGMQATNARGTYQGSDGSSLELTIADASAVSGLMEMAEALPQTTNSESDSGYEKDVMLGGHKVHEKYDTHSRHAELQTIVAKRFAVELTGNGVDMATLESALGSLDLGQLEALKDANPK